MSYRPGGWKNRYKPMADREPHWPIQVRIQALETAFEAGADAMIEALKAKGLHFEKASPDELARVIPFLDAVDTGTLVFIPDEEGK